MRLELFLFESELIASSFFSFYDFTVESELLIIHCLSVKFDCWQQLFMKSLIFISNLNL